MDYSLDQPQFYSSYIQTQSWGYYYIFGIFITVIVAVFYFVQSTILLPKSDNRGNIIPHIFSLKCGALALYPTFSEYLSYSWGFMAADFPWANSVFGEILSDLSQYVPPPYAFFYLNMNIGATYLLALIVIVVIAVLAFIISKTAATKYEENYKGFRAFQYNFFILGATVAASMSIQGCIMNPIDQASVASMFYIVGIALYILIVVDACWSVYQDRAYVFKSRIIIKGTLLSVMHFSPIPIASSAVFSDLIFAGLEFYLLKSLKTYPITWLINNILINIALVLVIFVPSALISVVIASSIVVVALIVDGFFHIRDYCYPEKQKLRTTKNAIRRRPDTEDDFMMNTGNFNIWDIKFDEKDQTAQFNNRNNDHDATKLTFDSKKSTYYEPTRNKRKNRGQRPRQVNQLHVSSNRRKDDSQESISDNMEMFRATDFMGAD